MTSNTESYSREEIVTNHIVVRLPVKSLLRFKCVRKSWLDLIKSSSFIRKHFDIESIRARLTVAKFGVDYNHDPQPLRAFDLFLLNDKIYAGCVPTHRRIYRCEGVSDFRDIHGPIDGLFLLEKGHFADNVRFAWWNPATKECRLIPRVEFELQERFQDCCRMVGIGLDQVNQDYKVVWLRTFWDEMTNELYPKIFAALYSSKNDSWKNLEPDYSYECQLSVSQNCTYINGKYHWMSSSKEVCNKDNVYFIRTFDFVTELFGEMTGPPIPGDHWATLMLRGGSLSAISSGNMAQPQTSCYDIWVRIRENNWIKVYTVNPPIPSHWPNGIWEYDKFIYELTETNRMVFYDQTVKQVTNLGFDHFQRLDSGFCWTTYYKESLIPIKRENPTEQDNVEHFFTKF